MATPLEPEVVESVPEEKAARKRRAQVRFKIRRLPPEVRQELDARLTAVVSTSGTFGVAGSRSTGNPFRIQSLTNYHRNELRSAAPGGENGDRAGGGNRAPDRRDDDEQMSLALLRLVQTAIFDLLVHANRTVRLLREDTGGGKRSAAKRSRPARAKSESGGEADAAARSRPKRGPRNRSSRASWKLAVISALGKTTATRQQSNHRGQERGATKSAKSVAQQIAATTAHITQAAREGGMSPEAEATIRSMLMEIKL